MPKTTDPKTTRRVLETAAALQNFDLDSLSLYSGFDQVVLTRVLLENQEFFERRATHGRTPNLGGRWLVKDHASLLLHAIELSPPETVDLTAVPEQRGLAASPHRTSSAQASSAAKAAAAGRAPAKRAATKSAHAGRQIRPGVSQPGPSVPAQTTSSRSRSTAQPAADQAAAGVVELGTTESPSRQR